jgi:hypothetical protein
LHVKNCCKHSLISLWPITPPQGGKRRHHCENFFLNVKQTHQKGYRPNSQGEVGKRTKPFASKLKVCTYTNGDEEDPNGSL